MKKKLLFFFAKDEYLFSCCHENSNTARLILRLEWPGCINQSWYIYVRRNSDGLIQQVSRELARTYRRVLHCLRLSWDVCLLEWLRKTCFTAHLLSGGIKKKKWSDSYNRMGHVRLVCCLDILLCWVRGVHIIDAWLYLKKIYFWIWYPMQPDVIRLISFAVSTYTWEHLPQRSQEMAPKILFFIYSAHI